MTHRRSLIALMVAATTIGGAACAGDDSSVDAPVATEDTPDSSSPATSGVSTTTQPDPTTTTTTTSSSQPESTTPSTSQPDPTTTTTTTTTSSEPESESTTPTTSEPDPTTTTSTSEPESTTPPTTEPEPLTIATAEAVAATSRGVLIDDGSNTWDTMVADNASPRGLALLIDDLVVYQPSTTTDVPQPVEGFAIISDDGAELYGEEGRRVTVFDVGHIDGRATILAQSAVDRPANPDEADGELVLIDALNLERTVLREAGGWESGYTDARFGAGALSAMFSVNAANSLEILELDGTVRHEIELASDTPLSLLDFDEAVWLLEPDFVGDEFDPVLRTRQFDLATADVRDADLPLIPVDGLGIDTGFCGVADFVDGQLVCDRSQDSPIFIDVDIDDAVTTAVPSITFGTVRFRASQ